MVQRKGVQHRVQEEIAIHSTLKHPSILEMFTYFDDANNWYLVLELASHGELSKYIHQVLQRHVITEDEAASVLKQVVDGLLFLHERNIMHRDLSMGNLLVVECKCYKNFPHFHVKIADFGLATKLNQGNEKHMTLCGTPNYISPEVAAKASYGLLTDVWGLGCILYTLLLGTPPFETGGVAETLQKVSTGEYKMPEFLSIDAKDLIRRLLQKDPIDRIKLQEISLHPFISSRKGLTKFSNTVASVDSGILTISSSKFCFYSIFSLKNY